MEKETFLKATAKVQRECLFDEIKEVKTDIKKLRKGLHISAFTGGFVAVFAACGGYAMIEYFKRLGT